MQRYCLSFIAIIAVLATTAWANVSVSSPGNGSTVGSPVHYIATASTSTCSKGVASMGIYVDNNLTYVVQGASMNTELSVGAGKHDTVVEEWDYCGGATYTHVAITVSGGGGGGGHVLSNIQASGGWREWGELAPAYNICSAPCNGVTFWMNRGISNPSRSGNATEFFLGGSVPYSDVLFSNPVLGQGSTQGLPDSSHTLLPTIHNFTYDAYFFGSDLSVSQVLEFDVSMYFNGLKLIWGQQCRIAGGHQWDIWDNPNGRWVSTGAPCNPVSNAWNHVTIHMQRLSNNWLLFQSITLNGVTANINRSYGPASAPSSWWGVTVNYQMDGNHLQSPYTTYLDNFSLTYW